MTASKSSTEETTNPSVRVKQGSAKPLWARDPWLYRGGVAQVDGCPSPGDVVDVLDDRGRWIGRGHYAPESRVAVRLFSWHEHEAPDAAFWLERFRAAFRLRHETLGLGREGDTTAYRLVHAEGDGVPGLVIDRIGGVASLQAGTAAAMQLRPVAIEALRAELPDVQIVERHDPKALEREGVLDVRPVGEEPELPERVFVHEHGVPFAIAPGRGQKTGFYADQRDNRRRVAELVGGRRVADLFCYTGGFSLHGLARGASEVVGVDTSEPALELARAAATELGEVGGRARFVNADAVSWASERAKAGETFDVVIADPPRLVTAREHLKRGLARYRRIQQAAIRLAAPEGLLAVFSCSGLVSSQELDQTVAAALAEAGRTASVVARLGAGADHPFRLRGGGGEYLKGLLLRMLD